MAADTVFLDKDGTASLGGALRLEVEDREKIAEHVGDIVLGEGGNRAPDGFVFRPHTGPVIPDRRRHPRRRIGFIGKSGEVWGPIGTLSV